jgi:hypothetical protein
VLEVFLHQCDKRQNHMQLLHMLLCYNDGHNVRKHACDVLQNVPSACMLLGLSALQVCPLAPKICC